MKGLNRTEIIGNVGSDAKLGSTGKTSVANFSVAVNDKYKDSEGNDKETTIWFDVSIYGKRAEALAPYIKSGIPVFVAGRVKAEAWGEGKVSLKLTLGDGRTDFLFLGGGKDGDIVDDSDDQLFTQES